MKSITIKGNKINKNPYLIRMVLILLLCYGVQLFAGNEVLTLGKTYPIIEDDLLGYIKYRASEVFKNGEWERWQEKVKFSVKQKIIRPTPLTNITKTETKRSWIYDTSIIVPFDLTDLDGKIFAKRGDIINPLSIVSLKNALLFFNGDDKEQVSFAKKMIKTFDDHIKLILVAGSIEDANKIFKKPIYFGQEGRLTTKFNIHHVPALVEQEDLHLKVSEVAL